MKRTSLVASVSPRSQPAPVADITNHYQHAPTKFPGDPWVLLTGAGGALERRLSIDMTPSSFLQDLVPLTLETH